MIAVKKKHTKEDLLSRVSEEEIYARYFGTFTPNKLYNSPFRKDPTPSFGIKLRKDGTLWHTDFGCTRYRGDCISFVMQLFNKTYQDSLDMIYNDFNAEQRVIVAKSYSVEIENKKTIFNVIPRSFTKEDLNYWAKYSLTEQDLIKENVFSVEKLYINKLPMPFTKSLRFAYLFTDKVGEEFVKVYTPYPETRDVKFLTNCPIDLLSGWDKIKNGGNKVIVTKSKKDEMVLSKVFPMTCSTQNESNKSISPENISFLQEKFDEVLVFFDPDPTGIETADYYSQFGFTPLHLPEYLFRDGVKDISDLCACYGFGAVVQFLKNKNII